MIQGSQTHEFFPFFALLDFHRSSPCQAQKEQCTIQKVEAALVTASWSRSFSHLGTSHVNTSIIVGSPSLLHHQFIRPQFEMKKVSVFNQMRRLDERQILVWIRIICETMISLRRRH